VAVGAPAAFVQPALRRRDHVGLILDRPRPEQDLPVRAAGGDGEGGRYEHDVELPERAVQLGKAHIVANGKREPPERARRRDRPSAGLEGARLVVALLAAVEPGGHNLDAFPEFLLAQNGRRYALVDLRRAMEGAVAWPEPTPGLLFYQGMSCYFAFEDHEPTPDPMTPACLAVHERYVAEPVVVEDLRTEGYSLLRYAQGGRGVYRIGFYRLTPRP